MYFSLYLFLSGNQRKKLCVCIKPLFGKFNEALPMIEFIETYKILGASQFVFYIYKVGKDVLKVLQDYQRRGEVTMMR